jgi:hypothetical protein
MNPSVLIIVLLTTVILFLVWLFFASDNKTHEFSVTPGKPASEPILQNTGLRQNTFSSSDVLDVSLLYALPEKEEDIALKQKEFFFESVIHIMAPEGVNFMGYTLLQGLHNTGMYYGEKGLFYYEDEAGIVFSVMPLAVPPVFKMDEIGIFVAAGLVLTLRNPARGEVMQEKAGILAEELGGIIQC